MTKFYEFFKNVNGKADVKSHTVQYERLRDRVVHTHRTSYRSGWPRGLGELKRKPHLWIFVSVSVGSRPRCKSLTSATVWIPVPTEKKSGRNLDKIRTAQLQSFIEIATNSSFWWVTRSLIVPLISLISTVVLVYIIKQTLFTLVSWYSQHCMVYLRHLSFPHLCATMWATVSPLKKKSLFWGRENHGIHNHHDDKFAQSPRLISRRTSRSE